MEEEVPITTLSSPPSAYPPEDDEGDTEYKWRLLSTAVSPERFTHLVTQMAFRLHEGRGRCRYVIGVADDGTVRGLVEEDYLDTLQTVKTLACAAGANVLECRCLRFPFCCDGSGDFSRSSHLYFGELTIQKVSGMSVSGLQRYHRHAGLQVGFFGPVNAGKTSLVAVLLALRDEVDGPSPSPHRPIAPPDYAGAWDDGHGRARYRLLAHRHEMETGRSSRAVSRRWYPPWQLPGEEDTPPVVTLVDAGDGLTKSVIFALLHRAPHMMVLCLSSVDLEKYQQSLTAAEESSSSAASPWRDACALSSQTPLSVYLKLGMALRLPLILALCKRDLIEDEMEWEAMLLDFVAALGAYRERCGCRSGGVRVVESWGPDMKAVDFFRQEELIVVPLSSVDGNGFDALVGLLSSAAVTPSLWSPPLASPLHPPSPLFLPPPALDYYELLVDDILVDEADGSEVDVIAVRGRVAAGAIRVGQPCVLGPVSSGSFLDLGTVREIVVREARTTVAEAAALGAGEPALVVVDLLRTESPLRHADREQLWTFLSRFRRNKRHPKGRVLLHERPDRPAVLAVSCGFLVRLSDLWETPSILSGEPLLIARHSLQAVSLQMESCDTSEMLVRCRFKYSPEMLWVGELVCLWWPSPRGLALGTVTQLLPE